MTDFDVVVIGTGASGTGVAQACAARGRRVAIVDRLPYGGTCALRGCDPKKILVGAAELVDWSQRMHGSGIAGTAAIDWNELMRFKRSFTDPFPAQRESALRESGIATYHGAARFVGPTTVAVESEHLSSRNIVIATGARPAPLPFEGEALLATSTDFLDLDRLPKRIVFIGGGYIACEFAHLAARAGSEPVILQRGSRILVGFEPTLVDEIVDVGKEVGIDLRLNVNVKKVEAGEKGFRISGTADEASFTIDCDLAVHAAGRVPDLDDLALDAGGVDRTNRGVAVNEFLQSHSNPAVYAVGDCVDDGGLPLTPTASAQGEVVAENIVHGNRRAFDALGLASIVYTIPSLGMTGLSRKAAQERGTRFHVREADSTAWYSSRRIRSRRSRYLLLVEEGTERILGAHVLGEHTEELINIFSLAIRAGIPAGVLESTLFAYPTASSDIDSMLKSD